MLIPKPEPKSRLLDVALVLAGAACGWLLGWQIHPVAAGVMAIFCLGLVVLFLLQETPRDPEEEDVVVVAYRPKPEPSNNGRAER